MIPEIRYCFRCGREIFFDNTKKSRNGKAIPLDPDTDTPHNCNQQNRTVGEAIMDLEQKERERLKI